jgi:hypothetical protein
METAKWVHLTCSSSCRSSAMTVLNDLELIA